MTYLLIVIASVIACGFCYNIGRGHAFIEYAAPKPAVEQYKDDFIVMDGTRPIEPVQTYERFGQRDGTDGRTMHWTELNDVTVWNAPIPYYVVQEWSNSGFVGQPRNISRSQWVAPPGYVLEFVEGRSIPALKPNALPKP